MGLLNSKSDDFSEEPVIKKKKSLREKCYELLESMNNSIHTINDNLSSSYNGMKSEAESNSISSSISSDKPPEELTRTPKNHNTIPTLFEWKEGGTMVYLTGSFCVWSQFFIMSRKPNGGFQLVLDLPKGVYQYKFKVDNHWKHSSKHPFITDAENNVNNIMDTTKQIPKPKPIEKMPLSPNQSTVNNDKEIVYKKKHTEEAKNEPFGRYYPLKIEMNMEAPPVPITYLNEAIQLDYIVSDDISTNDCFPHKFINEMISENNSFKVLGIPPHVFVSHLTFQSNESINGKVVTVCLTHRLRNKLISVVYYKPRNLTKASLMNE